MSKISLSRFVWIIGGLLLVVAAPNVEASCGSANCFLVTGTQEGIASPGQIVLDLTYRYVPQDRFRKGSKGTSVVLVPTIDFEKGVIGSNHQDVRTINELAQLDVSYGVTERFALQLAIPFFNLRTHDEEHHQERTSGFGDLRLIGKVALWISPQHLLVGGVGIKPPTGEYKLVNHEGHIGQPATMPGTGSWDALLSVYYVYHILPHRFDAFFSGSYQITTENDLDYQFGNTLLLNGGVNFLLREKLTISLQVNMRQAPHDEFKGQEVPSSGGTWVYLTPGIKVQASPNIALYAHVQLPIYQFVNDTNLVPSYGLIFGVSYAF